MEQDFRIPAVGRYLHTWEWMGAGGKDTQDTHLDLIWDHTGWEVLVCLLLLDHGHYGDLDQEEKGGDQDGQDLQQKGTEVLGLEVQEHLELHHFPPPTKMASLPT